MNNIGENIKSIRKSKKVTQEVLSKKVGITKTYLSLIETCKKTPSLEIIYKISQALNVDPALIVTKDDSFKKIQTILKENDFQDVLKILSDALSKIKNSI